MSRYIRYRQKGGCYFFTVNLLDRQSRLLTTHIHELRGAFRFMQQKFTPVHVDGMVVLPDHIHAIWTLPQGDDDFSNRWRVFKAAFTKQINSQYYRGVSSSRYKKGEKGIWQRRFWEHIIRGDSDFENHMNYLHYNPVKHGYVASVVDWEFSTFHRLVREGLYSNDWGANYTDLGLPCSSFDD